MTAPIKFPFFTLVTNQCQAEATLAAITCFGNVDERQFFKPQAQQLKQEYLQSHYGVCLAQRVNTLISEYLEVYGELSDQLIIFISKNIHQ